MVVEYVVQPGDSLTKIARDELGDIARWEEIARLNDIEEPYTIYEGEVLTLPGGTRQVEPGLTITAESGEGGPDSPAVPPPGEPAPAWVKTLGWGALFVGAAWALTGGGSKPRGR